MKTTVDSYEELWTWCNEARTHTSEVKQTECNKVVDTGLYEYEYKNKDP